MAFFLFTAFALLAIAGTALTGDVPGAVSAYLSLHNRVRRSTPENTIAVADFSSADFREAVANPAFLEIYDQYKATGCKAAYEVFKTYHTEGHDSLVGLEHTQDIFCAHFKSSVAKFEKLQKLVKAYIAGKEIEIVEFARLPNYFDLPEKEFDTEPRYSTGRISYDPVNDLYATETAKQSNNGLRAGTDLAAYATEKFLSSAKTEGCAAIKAAYTYPVNKSSRVFQIWRIMMTNVPNVVDLRQAGIATFARNQGSCGSCVYNSLATVLESTARYECSIRGTTTTKEQRAAVCEVVCDPDFHVSMDALLGVVYGMGANACGGSSAQYVLSALALSKDAKLYDSDGFKENPDCSFLPQPYDDMYLLSPNTNTSDLYDLIVTENNDLATTAFYGGQSYVDFTEGTLNQALLNYSSRNIVRNKFDTDQKAWSFKHNPINFLPFNISPLKFFRIRRPGWEDLSSFTTDAIYTSLEIAYIKTVLAMGVPVFAGVLVTNESSNDPNYLGVPSTDIHDLKCEVPKAPTSSFGLNHQVVIAGYGLIDGVEVWLVKNSWVSRSTESSEAFDGFIHIPIGKNSYCIEMDVEFVLPRSLEDKLNANMQAYGISEGPIGSGRLDAQHPFYRSFLHANLDYEKAKELIFNYIKEEKEGTEYEEPDSGSEEKEDTVVLDPNYKFVGPTKLGLPVSLYSGVNIRLDNILSENATKMVKPTDLSNDANKDYGMKNEEDKTVIIVSIVAAVIVVAIIVGASVGVVIKRRRMMELYRAEEACNGLTVIRYDPSRRN